MVLKYKSEYRNELADIFCDIYNNAPFDYKWIKKDNIIRYFADIENTPNFCGFVYVFDNKIKGGCFGVINDYFKNKKYRINEIFIKREIQGRGCGKDFLNEIENIVSDKGIEIIELSTDEGIPAFGFYKKAGYTASQRMKYVVKAVKNVY